ncbi:MAG: NB-ARC domain-containing protein [Acidimicrobiales bacterium]
MLAVFDDTTSTVLAACAMRATLAEQTWDGPWPIEARMGIHYGTAIKHRTDYYGKDVAFTARLHDCAHGGQIIVSSTAAGRMAEARPDVMLRPLGEHRIRDFPDPIDVYQVDDRTHTGSFPPLRTIDAQPGNLPQPVASILGRAEELDRLTELAGDQRLITVTGPGGVGKTRLAIEIGHSLLGEFRDGIWFIDLSSSLDDLEMIESAATQLDLPLTHQAPDIDSIVRRLRTWSALLILDNCEQVIADSAQLASSIIEHCSGIRVVATSRQPLDVVGEQVLNLEPLGTSPDKDQLSPACRLFIDRSTKKNHRIELSTDDYPKIDELCTRLDGLPLAIELAAARSRLMSVDEMLDNMGERLKFLPSRPSTTDGKSRTLRSALDWSYRLLSESEQEMLRRLSVFEGHFTLDEVTAVGSPHQSDGLDVFDTLGALVDKSMVQSSIGRKSRYSLLETVREYAREELDGSGQAEELFALHGNHYLQLAEASQAELRGPDEVQWVDTMENAWSDIRAAHRWFMATGQANTAAELAAFAHEFGFWRMRYEYSRWAQAAISGCSEQVHLIPGAAYACTAFGAWSRGDHETCHSEATDGLKLTDPGDARALEMLNDALTNHAYFTGDLTGALSRVEDQYAEAERDGDRYRMAYTLWFHVMALAALGRWEEALPMADRAHTLALQIDNPSLRSMTCFGLAMVVLDDDPEEAERLLRESISLARSVGNRWTEAMSNAQLGRLAARSGSLTHALARLVESLRELHESENAAATWLTLTHTIPILIRLESYSVATVVWAAAESTDSAPPRTPAQQRKLKELIPLAQAALDGGQWEECLARGATATTSELVKMIEEASRHH